MRKVETRAQHMYSIQEWTQLNSQHAAVRGGLFH